MCLRVSSILDVLAPRGCVFWWLTGVNSFSAPEICRTLLWAASGTFSGHRTASLLWGQLCSLFCVSPLPRQMVPPLGFTKRERGGSEFLFRTRLGVCRGWGWAVAHTYNQDLKSAATAKSAHDLQPRVILTARDISYWARQTPRLGHGVGTGEAQVKEIRNETPPSS